MYLAVDTDLGVVESVRQNATTIATLFGLESKVDELMADFDGRIAALADFAKDKTAIVGMTTSGSFNVLGNDGRCSIIGKEIGFENIGVDAQNDTSTHGNEASFELIAEKAPQYLFVMDRDAAIGTDGAKLAKEIVENELVMGTEAYKNGILYTCPIRRYGTPLRAASRAGFDALRLRNRAWPVNQRSFSRFDSAGQCILHCPAFLRPCPCFATVL